jgi:hypothetical protein
LASIDLINDKEIPLQYYSAYNIIQQALPKDIILIGEGANTMVNLGTYYALILEFHEFIK